MSATVTLGEHFKRLFDLNGREDRASFWPVAALAFALIMLVRVIFVGSFLLQIDRGKDHVGPVLTMLPGEPA